MSVSEMAADIHALVEDTDQHYRMRGLAIDKVVRLIRNAEIGFPKSGNYPAGPLSFADFLKVTPDPTRVRNRLL